jgi:hypothetical protein
MAALCASVAGYVMDKQGHTLHCVSQHQFRNHCTFWYDLVKSMYPPTHGRRYLPGHPEDVRTRVQKEWTDHLSLPNYSLTRFMSSESEMLQWKAEGLPADLLSLQVS